MMVTGVLGQILKSLKYRIKINLAITWAYTSETNELEGSASPQNIRLLGSKGN